MNLNIMVGGEAGQGVQSVGFLLAKTLARGGWHVFADQDYESRVRGGHNFYRVRASDSDMNAIDESLDILIALDEASVKLHRKELSLKGIILSENKRGTPKNQSRKYGWVPFGKLAEEKAGSTIMSNTVAFGATMGLMKYDFRLMSRVIREHFGSGKTGEDNIHAARAGYEYVSDRLSSVQFTPPPTLRGKKQMLLNGNEAISLGAIAAGCKFVSAYPMTPASSIMEFMAHRADDFGMVVVQPEDEIAAINMTVGAGYAGVRAMTATSGSGLCLMVEGLGLAGMTETPIVVIDAQRPGPAVGLPTRTEQGDLQFVLTAHHGDFPRAVLAPASAEDAFWITIKAFNIAEKYQLPVIILTDQHLASSYSTVDPFDLRKVKIVRGKLFANSNYKGKGEYKRHQLTPSGISVRAFPGQKEVLVMTDADEHDEFGHMTEDAKTRTDQVRKRLSKLSSMVKDVTPPYVYGDVKADTLLIGWGSTYGAIREAVQILQREGNRVGMLHLTQIWPFPSQAVAHAMQSARHTLVIENNATGQLGSVIRTETGLGVSGKILKFDGRPFSPQYIVRMVRKGVTRYAYA